MEDNRLDGGGGGGAGGEGGGERKDVDGEINKKAPVGDKKKEEKERKGKERTTGKLFRSTGEKGLWP